MSRDSMKSSDCDLLVIGAGAGGLTAAITAKKNGLNVVVIEKDRVFGGTTAYSGGVLWIPGNFLAGKAGISDTREAALTYLKSELGNHFAPEAVAMFLDQGPRMLEFFERETEVKFTLSGYPDYHPNLPGGSLIGRAVTALPYDARNLGRDISRLRPPLATMTFIGMMFNSSNEDLKHFFRATRSVQSALYVARRLISHLKDLLLYHRGVKLTSGNALVARLVKSAVDLGIPIRTQTSAMRLLMNDGKVCGADVLTAYGEERINARRAVVLACGGFPHDREKLSKAYPHLARGGQHFSPTPEGNVGDGINMAEAIGADFEIKHRNAAAWIPVSHVPQKGGKVGLFPHLVDRYKPGIIAVNQSGRRFANESNSYHDTGEAMIRDNAGHAETAAWLVCDHRTLRKYGLGFAKPAPVPVQIYIRSGYLKSGTTIEELSRAIGVEATALAQTIKSYNVHAKDGEDPEFGRGSTAFNRFLGDPEHKPNPNVGPIGVGPYYAVKIWMGDLGTFDGLTTDLMGQVLDQNAAPIIGLYAVGNDRASIMGGHYPAAGITLGPIMALAYVTGCHLASTTDAKSDEVSGIGEGITEFPPSDKYDERYRRTDPVFRSL